MAFIDCSISYMKCSLCYKYGQLVMVLVLGAMMASNVHSNEDEPRRLSVITTTAMVADAVKHVGGDRVEVVSIMGEGVDPHLYKPKASDIRRILAADLVLYTGLKLEGRMGDAFKRARARGLPVQPITAGLPPKELLVDEAAEGYPDPHVWMDVALWSRTLDEVTKALCDKDPEGCETYRLNAKSYQASLLSLHQEIKTMMQTIPEQQRVLVTAHDAFRYFGRAYGIKVRGIQGISTESEAGLADLNDLVSYLVEHRIPATFVESSVSRKNVQALVEGTRARGHEIVIGGELYSDAMGKPGTPEGTYVGMIRHNAETVCKALGGTVSPSEAEPAVGS